MSKERERHHKQLMLIENILYTTYQISWKHNQKHIICHCDLWNKEQVVVINLLWHSLNSPWQQYKKALPYSSLDILTIIPKWIIIKSLCHACCKTIYPDIIFYCNAIFHKGTVKWHARQYFNTNVLYIYMFALSSLGFYFHSQFNNLDKKHW